MHVKAPLAARRPYLVWLLLWACIFGGTALAILVRSRVASCKRIQHKAVPAKRQTATREQENPDWQSASRGFLLLAVLIRTKQHQKRI